MKALFIGGTGIISTAISRHVLEAGWELYLLNRGSRNNVLPGAREIRCDINDEKMVMEKTRDISFDVVADFIAYTADEAERDYRLFKNKTKQYIFISSAAAYQKPPLNCIVTESVPLSNPYWQYSQDKIAGEDFLIRKYREEGFPVTIVRPSHTYDERMVPLGVHSPKGSWSVLKRILDGKPVIIHGDGTSLWTMTHNSDLAKGFFGLMANVHAIGEAVHITSDESLTWNQIYQALADALGKPLNAVHVSSEFLAKCDTKWNFRGAIIGDKANSQIFDNTKIKRLVPGFAATVRWDQGVRRAVEYILAHKECQPEDPEFDAWFDKIILAQEQALAAVLKE